MKIPTYIKNLLQRAPRVARSDNRKLLTGFTLIEILVSVGIMGVVLIGIIAFALWMNYYSSKTKADREASENARRIMSIITYEIRGSKAIYSPTTASSQLSLETSRYLPTDETDTYIDFFLCDSNLCMKKESKDPFVLNSDSTSISSLTFTKITTGSRDSIQVSLTVGYKNQNTSNGNYASVSLTSTAALRNY